MNKFCASLNPKKSGNYVWIEKVFNPKVALESLVVEIIEVLLNAVRIT
jgi:hypothetical protein